MSEMSETKTVQMAGSYFLPGLDIELIPRVQLLGKSRIEAAEYAEEPANDVVLIDDSPTIVKLFYALKNSRGAEFNLDSSYRDILGDERNQELIRKGEATEESLVASLEKTYLDLKQRYVVWAETAQRDGKNVILTSAKGQVSVPLQKLHGELADAWKETLGVPEGQPVYHYVDQNGYKQARALRWNFWNVREWPGLNSDWGPSDRNPGRGVLLGRRKNKTSEA